MLPYLPKIFVDFNGQTERGTYSMETVGGRECLNCYGRKPRTPGAIILIFDGEFYALARVESHQWDDGTSHLEARPLTVLVKRD